MSNMQVIEAYSRLKSLRQNLPTYGVEMKFVEELRQILELLEETSGIPLENFRIPASEIHPIVVGGNYHTGQMRYSDKPYCDYNFFVMKVDGVLGMFELLTNQDQGSSGKAPIGFRP